MGDLDQILGRATVAYSHTVSSTKKSQDFLLFLQRNRRMTVVVEYVLCGHRCSGHDEPYANDAISLIRHKIMQRDVEMEVETVYRTWTFIGSLWESITNVGTILLEVVVGASYNEGVVKVVQVSMEYSRKVHVADGSADSRVMGFRSIFLLSEAKGSEDVNSTTATPLAAATQHISNIYLKLFLIVLILGMVPSAMFSTFALLTMYVVGNFVVAAFLDVKKDEQKHKHRLVIVIWNKDVLRVFCRTVFASAAFTDIYTWCCTDCTQAMKEDLNLNRVATFTKRLVHGLDFTLHPVCIASIGSKLSYLLRASNSIGANGYACLVFVDYWKPMVRPTQEVVGSPAIIFSAPTGRPFRCVSDIWLLISGDAKECDDWLSSQGYRELCVLLDYRPRSDRLVAYRIYVCGVPLLCAFVCSWFGALVMSVIEIVMLFTQIDVDTAFPLTYVDPCYLSVDNANKGDEPEVIGSAVAESGEGEIGLNGLVEGSEANGGVDGVNGNVEGANRGAPDFSMIISQQLQNLLPAMLAQVSNQGNVKNQNSNVVNENVGNVIVNGNQIGCSYKEFLACNPKEYNGKGDVAVLTRWIEKMESVHDMSGL
ncbi:reverse transcriptase domain-containing protein [Tanacetum coccineum]